MDEKDAKVVGSVHTGDKLSFSFTFISLHYFLHFNLYHSQLPLCSPWLYCLLASYGLYLGLLHNYKHSHYEGNHSAVSTKARVIVNIFPHKPMLKKFIAHIYIKTLQYLAHSPFSSK